MKKDILEAPFLKEMVKVIHDMWLKGWAERNGGNVSYRLTIEEVDHYLDFNQPGRTLPLSTPLSELANEILLVTGTGKYFRNVILNPEENLGIIRIDPDGKCYTIIWGLHDGGIPTSELPAHLLSHISRMKVTGNKNRVILHTHATHLIALSHVLDLDEKNFIRKLWDMSSECIVVFPDGIGVLPWMVCGTDEIGEQTAEKMLHHSMVLWPYHGIFGSGSSLDEAFGLVDTAEKAAELLVKVISMGGPRHGMSEDDLMALAKRYNVKPMDGIIK